MGDELVFFLKGCPFCGGEPSEIEYGSLLGDCYGEGEEVYSVGCMACGCYMWADTEYEVIAKWNQRVSTRSK
jgi:Lar family restriction alleviation protein